MKHVKLFENFQLNESNEELVKKLQEVSPRKTDASGFLKIKKYNKEEESFIKHMDEEMKWNGGTLKKFDGDDHFSYDCMPGSSVTKDLKEAAKKFGVKIDVEKITNDEYQIWVVSDKKKVKEVKEGADDYSEAIFKMDKWMPEFDEEIGDDFESAQAGGINDLAEFFENNADEDTLASYVNVGSKGIDWKELAKQYLTPKKK